MAKKTEPKELELLEAIKRLLILQLVMNNATSEDVAQVLGVDSSTIRRIVPRRKLSNIKTNEK